ncbi:MAG: CoB--CoM heterodisulfide reductase iron-sulfur subunit A family protein [Anaerolineaceae bacterium]|jgi:heterodisulfide reductase subunit A|nr:MAG: CoB--CoM heterodisulfide reductase iron-sulfur subunit A family protein [Anaerolineaceae bacterium]
MPEENVNKQAQAGQNPKDEEPRIGVYVCNCGGNIGDVVKCDMVAQTLGKLPNVTVAHSNMFMCSDPGQKMIADDIKEKGINRVVIGACSIFLHEQTFRRTLERAGLNPYLYYHVGLREQVSWVHHGTPKEATEKSIRMMAAGIAKARNMKPLEPVRLPAHRHALVIGGGVAGLRSALDLARRGLQVTLVEKSHYLGGRMAQWERVFPTNEEARPLLKRLIDQVLAEPNITIHTGAQVAGAKGYVGNYTVTIRQQPRGVRGTFPNEQGVMDVCPIKQRCEFNYGLSTRKAIYRPYKECVPEGLVIDWEHCTKCGECVQVAPEGMINLEEEAHEFTVEVGAVVLATGFQPYEPFYGEMGWKEYPEVITLPQLHRLLDDEGPSDGKFYWNGHPVRNVALIHCVGSRQVEGVHRAQMDGEVNNYCSRVCCTASLSMASLIRQKAPDAKIYEIYEDIRAYGRWHEDYYTRASKNNVTFLRYYAEEIPEVRRADEKAENPLLVKVRDHLTWGEEIEIPVDLVVLSVGMMPNPVQDLMEIFKVTPGSDRFLLEVHPKLRPVETAVNGVVLAGTAQGPMNIQESCAAASAAAAKVSALIEQAKVELEPYVAHVDPDQCQGSGECVKVCPQEEAIELKTFSENGRTFQRAVVTPANCNGCGVCVSVCPNRALDVQGWRLDEYEAMVEAIAADIPAWEGAA